LLGFDVLNGEIGAPSDEIGLLRMASDAIGNAIKRDLLDRERRRLEASLDHARRMETVGSLTSGIAHNFNNIIGAILGYTEMAEAQVVAPGGPIHAHLAAVRRSGERARDLVEQILTFGNRRDSAHRPMCIRRLIDESASLLSASLPSSVRIVVDATPDSAIVSGQFTQLQQVILNLGHNAAQAMDGAGNIELMAEVHDIAKTLVLSHGQLPVGRYVRIAVRDNGRGIDEKTLERIFEPFFTTRRSGNGLGLATARAIVSEHHGAINVTTAIGKGSLFEVWLPCTDTAERALGSRLPEFPRGAGETIMVIDDDPERLLSDEDVVAALGYEPVGFVQINDALVAYRAAPIRFDAILIGHARVPVQALKLAATLHDAAPGLPIILAASTGDFDAERLAAAGVSELLRHPLSSTELAAALARCLQTPTRPAILEQYSRVS
jgi:signal transduction histidine kinase